MSVMHQEGNETVETRETLRQTLERRYLSRLISCREATKNARTAARRAQHLAEGRLKEEASGHNSACAEIHKIARDSGVSLDIENIRHRALAFEQEAEAVAQAFKVEL